MPWLETFLFFVSSAIAYVLELRDEGVFMELLVIVVAFFLWRAGRGGHAKVLLLITQPILFSYFLYKVIGFLERTL